MGSTIPTPARGAKLTISLGLVNVGVKYAPLVREQRTKGHYVCAEHRGPVKQQYVCEADGKPCETVTAYDHVKGPVILDEGAKESLKSERDGRLALEAFVAPESVDPLRLEKAYLVWPEKGHETGYDLLCDALEQTGKALVGTATLASGRTASTKTVMIRYGQGCLIAHALTYDANVTWNDHALVVDGRGDRPASDPAMVATALTLIEGLPEEFDFTAVTDEYDARLRATIEAMAEGRPMPESDQMEHAEVLDLMDALKASVEAATAGEKKKAPAKKRASKRAAA